MTLVSVLVLKRRVLVNENGWNLVASRGVPVPERQSESWVANKASQDSLIEIQVPAMEGKEEPTEVDLNVLVRKPDLVIRAITVGAVNVGLLNPASWVVLREFSHML